MDDHPATASEAASAVRGQNARAEGHATKAPPPGLLQGGLKGSNDPPARGGKDLAEGIGLERRDTADSCLSDFSQRRTNTGWSIAASTATDWTDPGPSSPDILLAEDGPDLDTDDYASSPRRRSLFLRLMTSQKARASPHCPSPDSLAPRPRRLEQMTPRKSSLNISAGPTMPSPEPRALEKGEASPPSSQEPCVTETGSKPQVDNAEGVAECDRDNNEPICSMGGRSRQPDPQAQSESAVTEGRLERRDGADGDTDPDDDAPTPGPGSHDENLPGAAQDSAGASTPHTRTGSSADEASDSCNADEELPALAVDDSIIYEVCEQVLQQALGVQLHDVALAGVMPAAYESVSYFLDELSRIILNSGLSNTRIVINESTRGRAGSSNVPTWGAGGASGGASGGAGAGGSGNGSSSQKRCSGGHDDADFGDGAQDGSLGGGKRQRVSLIEHQSTNMQFACPFRKRNPVRFNVRDFKNCALQPFPDMSQVKRHVKNFHKPLVILPFTCQRCRLAMGSQEALDRHVSVPTELICTPQRVPSSADPEDGITPGIEEILNDRKAGTKIDTWQSLWRLLFTGDADSEIAEADFVPPTELEEVYAEFNTDHRMRQLQGCIQQGLGSGSNTESLLSVFRDHLDSVFDACRWKTSNGLAGGRGRMPAQLPLGQMAGRRGSSVRLHPGRPASRGQGSVDSSIISSPVVTPNSAVAMLGNVEQPVPVAEAQSQSRMPSVPPTGAYPGLPMGTEGVAEGMMPFKLFSPNGPHASQGGQPVPVPPAAFVHVGFGGQGQNTASLLGGQHGEYQTQPRLLPTSSAMDFSGFLGQVAADFGSLPTFDSHGYQQSLGLGHSMQDLCLRPPPQHESGARAMQARECSPTSPGTIPMIAFDMSAMDEGFGDDDRRNSVWRDTYDELLR
ncbi:hypothetical protein N658DRAFT_346966 [Parathielavia hyrcaniae]|uniref:Uncharacterized protein n=1 Tax=Parathielavia hyrcaniae TaxID=113614 RepID=A0AAN6PRT4_9PEZI|nr:hypothetical protein N658DRAFT_346966 [Parathielavia hyrcaniae]